MVATPLPAQMAAGGKKVYYIILRCNIITSTCISFRYTRLPNFIGFLITIKKTKRGHLVQFRKISYSLLQQQCVSFLILLSLSRFFHHCVDLSLCDGCLWVISCLLCWPLITSFHLPITTILYRIISSLPTGPSMPSATTATAWTNRRFSAAALPNVLQLVKTTPSSPRAKALLSTHVCYFCWYKQIRHFLVSPG